MIASGGNAMAPNKTTEYMQRFSYSASHNLVSKRRTHTIKPRGGVDIYPPHTNINFEYSYDGRPHAPTRVGDLLLSYDASGNVIERRKEGTGATEALTWDDDGRLVEVQRQGAHQRNYYDSAGLRVIKKSRAGETLYASTYFDLHNGQRATKHIFAGGQRVASVLSHYQAPTMPGGGPGGTPPGHGGRPPGHGGTPPGQGGDPMADPLPPDTPGVPYYFHQDHLGSTSVLTDRDGEVHEHLRYFPDGETWIEKGPRRPINGYRFSGKPTDPETGFADFGQRFYDPRTSLWLGTDPQFTEQPGSAIGRPLLLASYAYAGHSPLVFVDPDGRDVIIVYGANGPDPDTGVPKRHNRLRAAARLKADLMSSSPHLKADAIHVIAASKLKDTVDKIHGEGRAVSGLAAFGHGAEGVMVMHAEEQLPRVMSIEQVAEVGGVANNGAFVSFGCSICSGMDDFSWFEQRNIEFGGIGGEAARVHPQRSGSARNLGPSDGASRNARRLPLYPWNFRSQEQDGP